MQACESETVKKYKGVDLVHHECWSWCDLEIRESLHPGNNALDEEFPSIFHGAISQCGEKPVEAEASLVSEVSILLQKHEGRVH
jgi:hypothetical protein